MEIRGLWLYLEVIQQWTPDGWNNIYWKMNDSRSSLVLVLVGAKMEGCRWFGILYDRLSYEIGPGAFLAFDLWQQEICSSTTSLLRTRNIVDDKASWVLYIRLG